MLLIFLSWIYITFTTINLGTLLCKLLRLKVKDIAIISVSGFFFITTIASAWAVFGRINWEFHIALLLSNGIIAFAFRESIGELYKSFWLVLKALPSGLKLILGINAILILAQCASIPYVIDNESYYIQTIKWINEYGFVKGVANLHFFLAQTSGWHITQSAFNFSFLYGSFNDISGFCLLLGNIFAITRLAGYFENGNRHYLMIGLLPLANVLLFQFISAPSPDMPVYVFSFMIFFYVMERYRDMDTGTFILITLLVLFSLYIKTTAAALIVIPLVLFIKDFRVLKPALVKCFLIGAVILVLFITKNTIVSGHPFFPVTGYQFASNDYSLPGHIAKQYYNFTKLCAYFVTQEQFDAMSVQERFMCWITLPKLHGLFNKLVTMLAIAAPIIIYRYYNRREMWLLYFLMCAQLALLALSSPQYRFFLNFVLLFSFCIIAVIITKKNAIMLVMGTSVAATAFVLFVPIDLNRFTSNKFVMVSSTFSTDNLVFPYKNTKYDNEFKVITEGNLRYYSPVKMDFFWGSGDGPLPCINERQVKRFYKKYKVLPQMRTENMADGFYAEDITKYE